MRTAHALTVSRSMLCRGVYLVPGGVPGQWGTGGFDVAGNQIVFVYMKHEASTGQQFVSNQMTANSTAFYNI